MSYDGHICSVKSIAIDRKGVNFVVLRFLNIKRAKLALLYGSKTQMNQQITASPNCALVFHLVVALLIVVVDWIKLKVKNHGRH
jgi:hypothetical protein